ncbi:MAG TPA: CAAX prenyl protease-related protein [Phycisphaerae bacterium]|nr:CAAX prenyl protease-related protein [Phycisphaerae bacterium]HRY68759.1 CAAX prenyl protease-related protein [Phycisphaerae bacterium]HSA28918.1 CAAX prenyl protease-related protein [Phycisphaerae bacterium]
MSDHPTTPHTPTPGGDTGWLAETLDTRPEIVWMAPFMIYLILLGLNDKFPEEWMAVPIAIRGFGGLAAFWIVRRRLPSLGRPHVLLAIVLGILAAAGWVLGQYGCNAVGLGGSWFGLRPGPDGHDPRVDLTTAAWTSQAVLRITVATITVPVVEELFWRGFMLRTFINWQRFETVPLGTFTWLSFLGTALLSTVQHPANWGVSILCWMAFNALFYWKKSLLFLMIVHGVTNLALYLYVITRHDWIFW